MRPGTIDRKGKPQSEANSDHAGSGQCPVSAKFVGHATGRGMRYRTSVPTKLFAKPEPDRAVLAIDKEGGFIRSILREFRGVPSRDRRSDVATSERKER